MKALSCDVTIGSTTSGATGRKTPRIQFSDMFFHIFLVSIGLTPNKSKTIGAVAIPQKYFFDFLRGHLDGDGCIYSYWDKRWKSSFMFYTTFASASKRHIEWLQKQIHNQAKVGGHISKAQKSSVYQLRYSKEESLVLWNKMYPNKLSLSLSRKRLKIDEIMRIIDERQENKIA